MNQSYYSRIKNVILKVNLKIPHILKIYKKKRKLVLSKNHFNFFILLKRKENSSHDFCLSILKVFLLKECCHISIDFFQKVVQKY